jgi:hypothetical protein
MKNVRKRVSLTVLEGKSFPFNSKIRSKLPDMQRNARFRLVKPLADQLSWHSD